MPTTSQTHTAPPELDALVRSAVFAAWALGNGNMADRAQAFASLKAAVWPFVRGVSMDGDDPPEGFDVHVPYGVVPGQLQRTPDTVRSTHQYGDRNGQDSSYNEGYAPGVKRNGKGSDEAAAKPGLSRWQTNGSPLRGLVALPVPVRGGWKQLGECTHEDLAAVVDHYTRLAGRNERRAGQFRRLLQALYDHEEDTVGALPTELIEEALHG